MKKIGQVLLSDPKMFEALKEKIIQLRVSGKFECLCGKIHSKDWEWGCIEIDWGCNEDSSCIPKFLETKLKTLTGFSTENLSLAEQFLVESFLWRWWVQLLQECKKSGYEMDSREEAEHWFRESTAGCKIFSVFLLGKDMQRGAETMNDAWYRACNSIDFIKANLYFGSGINRVVYIEGIGYSWCLPGFPKGTHVMFKIDCDGLEVVDLYRCAEYWSGKSLYKKVKALRNRAESLKFVGGFESLSPKQLLWT
jgi:hypothetical protein